MASISALFSSPRASVTDFLSDVVHVCACKHFYSIIVSCFMMSELSRFDDAKAAIRITFLLSWQGGGADSRQNLLKVLKGYGVGATAVYSSLRTLEELALVESRDVIVEGRRNVETVLTDKGYRVASVLVELEKLLPLSDS